MIPAPVLSPLRPAASGGVSVSPPVNITPPTLDNPAPSVGDTVTGTPGTWMGSPTLSYQWLYADDTEISGANLISYTVQQGEASVGQGIKLKETATNGAGSASANSATTDVIPPYNITPPILFDDGAGGGTVLNPRDQSQVPDTSDTLSFINDTWTTVDFFTYEWKYAVSIGGPTPGTAPTQSMATLGGFGSTIYCAVTAHRNGATTTVNTDISGVIVAILPP